MTARLVIAASLCAIAPLYGCPAAEPKKVSPPPPMDCEAEILTDAENQIAPGGGIATPVDCKVVHAAEANPRQKALALLRVAVTRLFDGKQQEAIACATEAQEQARALPHARISTSEVDRQKFIDTIAFVRWMAGRWHYGGQDDVEVPKCWKEILTSAFQKVVKLSGMTRSGEVERKRAVGMTMVGLAAMSHFDPTDHLKHYDGLLAHGHNLLRPWQAEPINSFQRQVYILFRATADAWPHARAERMEEFQSRCEDLKKVTEWHPDLEEDAKRARATCMGGLDGQRLGPQQASRPPVSGSVPETDRSTVKQDPIAR